MIGAIAGAAVAVAMAGGAGAGPKRAVTVMKPAVTVMKPLVESRTIAVTMTTATRSKVVAIGDPSTTSSPSSSPLPQGSTPPGGGVVSPPDSDSLLQCRKGPWSRRRMAWGNAETPQELGVRVQGEMARHHHLTSPNSPQRTRGAPRWRSAPSTFWLSVFRQSIQRDVPVGPVRLVGAGTVRLLDLLFVYEVADGVVGSLELSDIGAQHGPAPVPGRRW